jgi:hypothetical protein
MPEHLSTSKSSTTREEKIDRQMEDTFPASDPPSYSNHVIGAPADRESISPKADSPAVVDAEKKVKARKTAEPGKY